MVVAMLHQAFLLGARYELDRFGRITSRLFEQLNQRFYETTSVRKYFTMIYGEVTESGRFRFICAGHPHPLVYSREFRSFMPIPPERLVSFPPVGMFPSGGEFGEGGEPSALGFKDQYAINRIDLLSPGDLVLLYTDGLHQIGADGDARRRLGELLDDVHGLPASAIAGHLRSEILGLQEREDDISFVVIKRS